MRAIDHDQQVVDVERRPGDDKERADKYHRLGDEYVVCDDRVEGDT